MRNKKIIIILLLSLCLMVFGAACGDDNSDSRGNSSTSPTVSDVLEQGMEEADSEDSQERQSGVSENAPAPEEIAEDATLSTTEGIDIDLTAISSTMVYSEVYNMMMTPDDYIGKTVKMSGAYATYHDDATGNDYYACIIQDATACCTQGMEFVLADGNYPTEEGMEVTVSGVFDIYTEGEAQYCTLRDAKLC